MERLLEQASVLGGLLSGLDMGSVLSCSSLLLDSLSAGGKVLLCGNGGSAGDCQHFAAELLVRFRGSVDRRSLAAISLVSDGSVLTACGNDFDFGSIFSRQVSGLGRAGDVLVGISTSGNSSNVVSALEVARGMGLRTLGLLGGDGGRVLPLCDAAVVVRSFEVARVQECHLFIEHLWCDLIERGLFPDYFGSD